MTEQQAREQGLNFTGIYSSNKEEVKERIAEIRKKFPKARIALVNVPHSKLSRGGPGMGYSAYADKTYSAYQIIERAGNVEKKHADLLKTIKERYEQDLSEEKARYDLEHLQVMQALETISNS